ncbi:MAG: NACHT domain-containing protein [Limnothrix sp. CACIAM 69d]|nr:MAG: NACHT domain-containing protein [Limnothrix sp. CACIAM 69d]
MPNESAAPQPEPKQDENKPTESEAKGRPTAEQRFVVQAIQALAKFAPVGGSSGAFLFFAVKQEWALAVVTLPFAAGAAFWARYTNSVINRLSEIGAARGTAHVNTLVSWLKIADEAMKWQLSGFESKYLKCQGWACESDRPIGLDGVGDAAIKPLLQEIFVPLELSGNSQLGGYKKQRLKAGSDEPCIQSIWDVLRQVKNVSTYRQMLICAKGGYGKTTLLKHMTYVYSQGIYQRHKAPKLIPFLTILATSWSDLAADNAPDLPDFLTKIHVLNLPEGKSLKLPPNWIWGLLNRGEALVMFDGFDEVPLDRRSAVSRWINRQMWNFPKAIFMVTSRPDARADYEQPLPNALFWVRNFSEQQQQQFIQQWYGAQEIKDARRNTPEVKDRIQRRSQSLIDQLQARPELADLAGNPLLLNMMCRFHREHEGQQLPQRRVELYQDICEVQTARRPKGRGIALGLRPAERLEILQILALAMMLRAKPGDDHGHKQIKEHDLLNVIVQPIGERDPEVSARDFLRQMVEVSELLVETQEKGIYEFSHLSFQEFLAASEVVRLRQESILYDKFASSAWEATILLYGELVNPSNLIREAKKDYPDLAYKIYQTTAKRLDLTSAERAELERLKKTVASSRYEKLEALMKAGDWAGADDETYRLMITTVGKEEGQYFTSEELLNFPCEELLAIDRLWVKHSQGQFGFSVQKEIYVACGAKLDGEYPGHKIWRDFGTRVGWRENDNWKSRAELKMNPHLSPKGEFPIGWKGRGGREVSSLASRLVNCSRPQS